MAQRPNGAGRCEQRPSRWRRCGARWLRWVAPLGIAGAAGGCAAAVESPRLEDRARRQVPVAICLTALERYGTQGVVPALKPPDYWRMVLPSYDPEAKTVDTSAGDCAGRFVFSDTALGTSRGGIVSAGDEQVRVADAPGKFKIVWLSTHQFEDTEVAGPLALVRPLEGRAEVYAVGLFRGPPQSSFAFERLGSHILLTASDGRCSAVEKDQPCKTTVRVFVMRMGRLLEAAAFATDRVERRRGSGGGAVTYQFTAIPDFSAKGFRLLEQVVVQDASQPAIQKSTLERNFQLTAEGKLVSEENSLWERVVPDAER